MNLPTNALFIDTSAWFAYLDKQSPHHAEALEKIRGSLNRLLTSDQVLWELSRSAPEEINKEQISNLIWWFVGTHENQLLKVSEDEESEAWKLYRKYDGPCPSFADCTSLIIIRKHKIQQWLSFNHWLLRTSEDTSTHLKSIQSAGKQEEEEASW